MRIQPVFFANPVYYKQDLFLSVAGSLLGQIQELAPSGTELLPPVHLFDQVEVDRFISTSSSAIPLLVTLSGATQSWVLSVAKSAERSLLWWYFPGDGLFSEPTETLIRGIVARNALPAVMDCWAHLRNRNVGIEKVFDKASLQEKCAMAAAMERIRSTRLLIIGYTQQWVVSASVDQRRIEDHLGIECVHIGLEELFTAYHDIPRGPESAEFARDYLGSALACREPVAENVEDAYRLYLGVRKLLELNHCNALTISCFSLVKQLGVTSCLALSLLNDDPRIIAACEGDLDAAVSMVIGKAVSGRPVFMGNPIYHLDDTLDIVHCTAPRRLIGEGEPKYTVRSHHETGMSVAQRIEVPAPRKATIFRVGNEFSEATLFLADFIGNPEADTCHTQFRFRIDSTHKRLEESLGCHHLVVFGDYVAALRSLFEGPLKIRVR
jgi:L-fucose isomerase-like protein